MERMPLNQVFTLMESGPVVLITTHQEGKSNIMTITWTMVMDFTPRFAITTGPWNYSYTALQASEECVIAIPAVDLIDQVIGIGTCSGANTDKFKKFGLTPVQAKHVGAPLIQECLANIECRVIDMIEEHNIIVLEALDASLNTSRQEKRVLHAIGDGTFVADGEKFDRRMMMRSKLPEGV